LKKNNIEQTFMNLPNIHLKNQLEEQIKKCEKIQNDFNDLQMNYSLMHTKNINLESNAKEEKEKHVQVEEKRIKEFNEKQLMEILLKKQLENLVIENDILKEKHKNLIIEKNNIEQTFVDFQNIHLGNQLEEQTKHFKEIQNEFSLLQTKYSLVCTQNFNLESNIQEEKEKNNSKFNYL